jgi:hypothetical protein
MSLTVMNFLKKSEMEKSQKRGLDSFLDYKPTIRKEYETSPQSKSEHNKGGLLGGFLYSLGKLGTGAFSVLEGVWDYTAGGIADFFGADEWAEEQFANNISAGWNQDLDEWYNPSKGMQIVGDVASGVGNTLTGVAVAAGVTLLTGGAAAPYAGTIAATTMGLGAAGNATSEAYANTGELGFKEYAYGALSGGTEMALEKFTGVSAKYATKLLSKETAKTVAKKSLLKGMWSDFKGEFVEEAISEFISPYYQRWTQVDPNAENATIQQIGYAGLVGGLSGALMGGIGTGISSAKALSRGNEISKNQDYTNAVVGMAEKFAQYETDNNTGKEAYQYISQLVADFKARDNGTGALTAMQKKLLGEMEHASVVLTYEPEIQRSKEKIIANADDLAQYINSRNIIDGATGKPFRFANGAELTQNDALVTQFAVADALGQLMLAPDSVYDLVSSKRTDGIMQADFRNFQKGGRAEHKQAVNELFGIDVDGMTYEDFIETIKKTDKAKLDSIQGGMSARAASKKAISYAKNTGAEISTFDKGANIVEGTTVYTSKKGVGGKIIAITKAGNGYYLYNGEDISKKLTKAQLLEVIDALNGVATATNQATETTAKKGQKTAKKPTAQTSPTGTQTAQETEKSKPKTAPKKKATVKKKTAAVKPATEKAKPTDKATQKREAIAKMRESEDTTERVLAELFDNGAADHDAVSAMKDGQDLSTVDKVAFFATGTVKDYVRQGLYTEKSLAEAIKEYADDIRAGKDVLVQVMDRAIELDGKQQPNWYKEQYHKAAEPTQATETAKPKKVKASSLSKARENLLKFVLRKDNGREALRGAFIINGKQYLSDGYFAVAYDDAVEGLTQAKGEPMAILEKIIEAHRTTDAARSVNVDMDAIRENYPPRGADSMEYLAKLGDSYFQTQLIRKVGETLKNPVFYVANKMQKGVNAPFTEGMLYIKANNGEAVILPIMPDKKRGLPSEVVRYTADFAKAGATETTTAQTGTTAPKKKTTTKKTAPKTKATETTTKKTVKEKTIHGKTYKDFTVEEFKALSAPFRGYYLAKSKKPNAIVFAQLGDFYEVFFDDAKTVANEFDLTLTGRAVNGYTDRVEMVGFPVRFFDDYKAKLNAKGLDVVKVDLDGKKVLYAAKTDSASTETQEQTEKPKKTKTATQKTTERTEDFGEKIGGARKDEWSKRGLRSSDISAMNKREVEKHVKKENVWKRPNWVQAVADGGNRGLLYAQNEIYKSLNTTPYIRGRYKATDAQIQENAKLYAEEIAEIQSMAEKATTAADFAKMGTVWLVENGYIEINSVAGRSGMVYTEKYYNSPALCGSNFIATVNKMATRFDLLGDMAAMEGFGLSTADKLPRGYEIRSRMNQYYIVKGSYRVSDYFKTIDEALAYGKEKFGTAATAKTGGKQHYTPPQLADIHRNGLDYRKSKDAVGDDFLRDFGIKGGEFGNWLSETDRVESLNYAYDAFCDLADALDIELTDIGLNGTLSIGFGSRGQGLSGAVAHYEPDRKVINLTKMKGAGSLAHEWWHAFEDYISGDTHQAEMTSNFGKLPPKTREAAYNLVNAINYREGTVEENQLEATKRHERNLRHIESFFKQHFKFLESEVSDTESKYFKRVPTAADVESYKRLKETAIKGEEGVYQKFFSEEKTIVDELSALHKEITNRAISKEDRQYLAHLIDQIGKKQEIKVQKHTQFYDDAIAISKTYAKDGGYWDSNCEMLARAFAAYITDKTSGGNDYLSGHSEGAVPVVAGNSTGIAYIMPRGEERARIGNAFAELFKAAKEDGLISSAKRTKPTTTIKYAVSETADLNSQPAGNKSQNLSPLQMKRAESFARTHVKGYENLTAAEKLEVEWTIASGWRYGASESDILSLAKISAQSGVGIGFADVKATTSDGKTADADAACYSRSGHLTIYLNPKSKRTVEVATLHELTHALEGTEGYAELRKKAEDYYAKHPEEKAAIDKMYRELYKNEQVRYADEILPSELTAHYIEKMLEKRNVLAQMTAEQPTFMQRCINWLKTRVDKLRGVDTQAADEVDILARKFVSTFNLNKGNGTQKTRYALSGKKSVITQGMTEQERYEILKDKKIALTAKADNAKLDSILSKLERDGNNVSYESVKVRDKIKLFRKIGEEFGIFKEYSNKDISLSFEYSKGSLEESAYKQKRNFNSFAKMLTCFDAVIENAVGIEVHNRNEQGYKTDMTLKEVYVLASAFEDGGEIVPVKLEVKEFTDKQNTLYIAIALESIKKDEVVAQGDTNNGVTQYPRSSNISISDLLRNVNPLDESFYKYIPKMFFEGENTPKKRYALPVVDSDGKALSAAQQDYFKDTVVRDKNGRLLTVYHGSPNVFTEFSHRFMNTNGNAHGRGFYFTDDAEYADGFKKDGGQLLKGYLDIRKPASETKVTIRKAELVKLIKATCEAQAQEFIDEESYDNIDDALLDTWVSNYVDTYSAYSMDSVYRQVAESVFNSCDNDVDMLAELTNGGAGTARVLSLARKTIGYDGIIFDNGNGTYQFVSFESNQFKNADNTNPTENADIRYALKGSDKVMTELPDERVTVKDVLLGRATKAELATQVKGGMSETSEAVKVLMTNAQAALERVLTENGVADATARTNYIRAGKYAAHNAIETQGGQYSLDGETRVGDSLGKIMQPIYKANEKDGKTYADFELYLLHHHNIDRMAVGKPVFGDDVTAADSQTAIAELDKEYPQFRKIAEKIWKFNDNNLQLSVDSGMYSQEYADTLREMYPHYVPTFREEYATRAAALMGKNNVWVNNAKKAAKGSSARILPIDDMMAAQTIQKTTSARINSLLVEMLERGDHDEFKVIATEDAEIQIDDDTQVTTHEDKTKNTHQVTFYHNGKKVTAQVSRLVFKGIEAFRASSDMSDNVALNAVAKVNSTFKKLVTSLNPFFSFFKNPIRDMQDALLYTRYSHREYLKNYNRARQEIAHNGHYWQEAKAAGITAASVYDYQKGIEYKQNGAGAKVKRFWGKLESASNAVEMAPRMAEYISAREAGLSVQEALLQAQDVTTNFGRGGTFAKKLNSTVMPFLNPAIQGFSKMWRSYTGENGKKAWVNLIIRSLILGIGATALNDLLNGDDEEYENLSDYVKEQNYVIALGGGDFLKIPKGRVIGVFGNAFLRGKRYAQGETDAWEGYFDSVMSSVTPVENFTRTIFSPITDAQTNTTWYGGAIESQKWNDTEPKNRYDESTSKIAIWLGSVFNYSPLKIDYLLEQYTGIVGDLVLPATSTQAESGIITQNMLVNSTTNSKWSTKFYSTLEDYTYKKTAGDLQAKGAVRYLNSINSTVSDMYNQKRTIQADKKLSNDEKLTQTKIIQAAINTLMQEAIGNAEYIYGEMGKYNLADDDVFDQAYLDSISVVMGEEYALKSYNKDVYEKATKINKLGIDYATYYDFYFGVKNITSDKKADGSTVAGSKKAKVINYVMAQNLSTAQKLVLIMAQGYSIADGDVKGLTAKQAKTTVAKYITSLNLTREEKTELAEMLGFTVKNGKIYFN